MKPAPAHEVNMSLLRKTCILFVALLPGAALAQPAPAPSPATEPTSAPTTPAAVAKLTDQITPGQGLTADQAAQRARTSSYDIRAGRDDVAAAQAAVDTAKAGYIPKLTGTARYTRLSDIGAQSLGTGNLVATTAPAGPLAAGAPLFGVALDFPSLVNSYTFQASLSIPLSDYILRVPHAVSAAESAEHGSEASLAATTNNVDLNARSTYYTWVRARLQVGVTQAALQTAQGHLDDVRKAFNVGSASRADVLRTESSLAQAELNLVRARNSAELTEVRLRTVIHDDGQAPLAIGEDVLAELPVADEDLADLTRRALQSRPELRALADNAEATRGRAKVQRAGYLPRIDLVGNVTDSNPNQRVFPQKDEFTATWDVSAQLTWTPTDIFGTGSSVRETQARAAQIESQREAAADSVRIEVVSAWQAVKEARQSIETTTKALGTAEEAYRVRRALFQNGRATSLEMTDSELDLTRARLDAVNARIDLRVAKASLAKAVGGGK
jgi:outer membrane protein TolC